MTQEKKIREKCVVGDGFSSSVISFGAMGMSDFYGKIPEDESSLKVLDRALELGVSMIDTADMYGRGHNERLLAKFIKRHPSEYANRKIHIATKFGIERDPNHTYNRSINNSPEYIRKACEESLKRLGIERIDLYYAHRVNPSANIAETMGTLAELKREGKIAHIGLCEVSAETLEQAHAVHPVAAVQSEYSLCTREMEDTVLPACRKLGVGFVAYSPLGRGFLTGKFSSTEKFDAGDFRLSSPRFQEENLQNNAKLLVEVEKISLKYGYTTAQVSLAWLLSRYEHLVAIPGTRSIARLEENCQAASLVLAKDDIDLLDSIFSQGAVKGERYTPEGMKGVNA